MAERPSKGRGSASGAAARRSTTSGSSARRSTTSGGRSRPASGARSTSGSRSTARPGTSRPATAARPRTPVREPVAANQAWVRGLILLGIIVMLAVTLVPTLRALIQQRSDTSTMADKVAAQRQELAELQREAELWKNPSYIEAQARERLKFVRIGDRAYTVIDPSAATDAPVATVPVVAAPMANSTSPWYGKLWQSVEIADSPTAGLPKAVAK